MICESTCLFSAIFTSILAERVNKQCNPTEKCPKELFCCHTRRSENKIVYNATQHATKHKVINLLHKVCSYKLVCCCIVITITEKKKRLSIVLLYCFIKSLDLICYYFLLIKFHLPCKKKKDVLTIANLYYQPQNLKIFGWQFYIQLILLLTLKWKRYHSQIFELFQATEIYWGLALVSWKDISYELIFFISFFLLWEMNSYI